MLKSILGAIEFLVAIGRSAPQRGLIRLLNMLKRMSTRFRSLTRSRLGNGENLDKVVDFPNRNQFTAPQQQLPPFQVTPGQGFQPQGRNMNVICFKCHGYSHFANACPNARNGMNRKPWYLSSRGIAPGHSSWATCIYECYMVMIVNDSRMGFCVHLFC